MNEQNFDYLKNQIKYSGFGDSLEASLKEQLEQGSLEFTLKHQAKFGGDRVDSTLFFQRSNQSDRYFFNRYDSILTKEGQEDPSISQTFYMGKDNHMTLKEGYNLLDGRAVKKELVNKDQQKYQAWVQLDFRNTDRLGNFKYQLFHENYGFDLQKTLEKHPIKELQVPEDLNRLMDSLKKGNRQSVVFLQENRELKRYIEAVPKFKSIQVYDSNQMKINPSQKVSLKESKATSQKTEIKAGSEDNSPKKTRKRKSNGIQ